MNHGTRRSDIIDKPLKSQIQAKQRRQVVCQYANSLLLQLVSLHGSC